MKKQLRPLIIFLFIAMLGAGGTLLGYATTRSVKAIAAERYTELQLFAKVLNIVQNYYVDPVKVSKLLEGAIRGMLRELDPHTNYMPPDIYKEFESETSGEFGGLGIEITVRKGVLTIISPIEDTPAWKAGIQPGDTITSIDGFPTKGLSLVEAAQLMRGKIDTPIVLEIMREGFEEPRDFKIVRGTVKIQSVKSVDLGNGFGYVRVTSFIENTAEDMRNFLDGFVKKHEKFTGLVIDLRRNPGGLLNQAVKISDMFLEKGTIVSTVGRDEKQRDVTYATQGKTLTGFPIIVLINEHSASASEIVAGALKDNKRALIMGRRSFGKGSVQSVIKLGNGSGLKLTVARYFTPSGKSIQAEGIEPDVVVDPFDAEDLEKAIIKSKVTREKDIEGHLKSKQSGKAAKRTDEQTFMAWREKVRSKRSEELSPKEKLLSEDYQVHQAYNYLKAWDVMKGL